MNTTFVIFEANNSTSGSEKLTLSYKQNTSQSRGFKVTTAKLFPPFSCYKLIYKLEESKS